MSRVDLKKLRYLALNASQGAGLVCDGTLVPYSSIMHAELTPDVVLDLIDALERASMANRDLRRDMRSLLGKHDNDEVAP